MKINNALKRLAYLLCAVTILAMTAYAGSSRGPTNGAPELDPGALGAALTVLVGAVMIIKDRKNRR
jgi:hypothetical protein